MHFLSKSKIMSGLQCPKRLWLEVKRPESMHFSDRAEQSFAAGHEVGAVARQLHPGGVLIGFEGELSSALAETGHMIEKPGDLSLFEATFQHGRVLVRADVLSRRGEGWHLVEVKSATELKPHYLNNVAIQAWVIEGAGLPLKTLQLWHVDNSFVYPGGDDYRGLFVREDVTEPVMELMRQVPAWAARCQKALSGEEPEIAVGKQCRDPHDCPFLEYCEPAEAEYPVSILPYGGALVGRLQVEGYKDLRDVPQERLRSERHLRVWRVTKRGVAELDDDAAKELAALPYPRYYLDFETVQFAVPVWPGTRPYEQLPFQWSCHIEDKEGRLEHREFLDTTGEAPMRRFSESLIAALGEAGPIMVYTSYERTVLTRLKKRFPDIGKQIAAILSRLYDLYPLAQDYYYHPDMRGSWSIKSVLPTIAPELDYGNLGEVRDGSSAQEAYRAIISPNPHRGWTASLPADLRAYCYRDTLALVEVARFFEGRRHTGGLTHGR
ncbi:MAG: DUF2779 domain-containing protein [Zoogloeaceae bacterium]|nr:DUF2779 domain-containing protein [Zoogloeaceae bacterium]MCK6385492.1 DUF2779 domain-containing protein [Rhodocyclaceae bacterium]